MPKSALDGFKLNFEDMNTKKRKISKANVYINKGAFKLRPKRQGIIKTYFKYLVEVILK